MSLVVATERANVLRLCANPDSEEIADATVDSIISTDALDWLNRRRPAYGLSSFTTVASQQDYDAKPANAYRVTRVWWQDTGWDVFSPDLRYPPDTSEYHNWLSGWKAIDNPAIVTEFYYRLSQYNYTFTGVGEETHEGKIRLSPVPGNTGDSVYFEYSYPLLSAITACPEAYKLGVRYFSAASVMRYLMVKRGLVRAGRDFSGGGGEREQQVLEDYMSMAEGYVPELAPPIMRG